MLLLLYIVLSPIANIQLFITASINRECQANIVKSLLYETSLLKTKFLTDLSNAKCCYHVLSMTLQVLFPVRCNFLSNPEKVL